MSVARRTMWIAGPVRKGGLIPKPPHGMFRRKPERFYNWDPDTRMPKLDKKGRVIDKGDRARGLDFVREVPADHYHLRMVVKRDIVSGESETAAQQALARARGETPKRSPKGGEK